MSFDSIAKGTVSRVTKFYQAHVLVQYVVEVVLSKSRLVLPRCAVERGFFTCPKSHVPLKADWPSSKLLCISRWPAHIAITSDTTIS